MLREGKMKLLYLLIILGLTACSSSPKNKIAEVKLGTVIPKNMSSDGVAKLMHDRQIFQMTRQEVITAIQDCHSADLRAVLYHGRVQVTGRYIPIVVQVQCAVKITR
tara:strand:+ start:19 stop:339 length:321 start_codon:yes stop_codon:yes gene_type:complete